MLTAIIPARGGSKGIKDKNLQEVGGDSLVNLSVKAASDSEFIERIILTSDSSDILEHAIHSPKLMKHNRHELLANDTAPIIDTILALEPFIETEAFVLLQPTSPLRTTRHIDEAARIFFENGHSSLISVCEAEHAAGVYGFLKDNKWETAFSEGENHHRRQDMPPLFRINGAIYICKFNDVKMHKTIKQEKTFYYQMDKMSSIDVDDHYDLTLANLFSTMET